MTPLLKALLLVSILLTQEDPTKQTRDLVEKLRSDKVEEREGAERDLMNLGRMAIPELTKLAHQADRDEASVRARRLLRLIPLRAELSASLLKEVPDILTRGTSQSASTWAVLVRDLTGYRVESDGKIRVLYAEDRMSGSATRKDLSALARAYATGSWRDPDVEDLIFSVLHQCEASVPGELKERLQKREEEGRELAWSAGPSIIPPWPSAHARLRAVAEGPLRDCIESALGEDRTQAIPALIRLLVHTDPSVRQGALELLLTLNAIEASKAIISVLGDASPEIRTIAGDVLGKLGAESGREALRTSAAGDRFPEVRKSSLCALGMIGHPDDIAILEKGLGDSDGSVRHTAVNALALFGSTRSVEKMVPLLNDPEQSVRREVVLALGKLGATSQSGRIRALALDVKVMREAIRALGMLRDETSLEILRARLDDVDVWIRKEAALALARLGSETIFEYPDVIGNINTDGVLPRRLYWELNRFNSLDPLKRAQKVKLSRRRYDGSTRELLMLWEKETGWKFRFKMPDADADHLQAIRLPPGSVTLEEALFALRFNGDWASFLITGPDTIAILPDAGASDWWLAWIKERRRK